MFAGMAAKAVDSGLIAPPPAGLVIAQKRHPRTEPRKRGANLGVVVKDGHRHVIEYRPGEGLVVRRFHAEQRHVLTLLEVVDLAHGQQIFSTRKVRSK